MKTVASQHPMRPFTLRLSDHSRAALMNLARREGLTPSACVRKALHQLLEGRR